MSSLMSSFAELNPFSKGNPKDDAEDQGETTQNNASIAGGGHAARASDITKTKLRVSQSLKSFLVSQDAISKRNAAVDSDHMTPALQALVDRAHIEVPAELTDRSRPLPEYFVSSTHNTYLMAHQLFGTSSAGAYDTVLKAGARCVEIDAWDNEKDENEPKVTHGYTLVSHIPFRSVCEAIRDGVDREAAEAKDVQGFRPAPIMVSLENHCNAKGQLRLAQIMEEVWGNRLLSKGVREEGKEEQAGGEHVLLSELGSKIVVIVEHHLKTLCEVEKDIDEHSESGDEEEQLAFRAYQEKKKTAPANIIIPELAKIGVYAQSVKPSDDSWYSTNPQVLANGPHHHLINVSESGLLTHLPKQAQKISEHNAHHLMRVFPKGTRISSKNLKPVPFWGIGAQICALNWQTFGASLQINEALFSSTDGYVLKPRALRAGGSGILSTGIRKRLTLHIGGATDLPLPKNRKEDDEMKPYVSCILSHPDNLAAEPPKRKTAPYKHHNLGFMHRGHNPPSTDPVWDEKLDWEYDDNELVFLRILVKSDDSFAANPIVAVTAVRLSYAVQNTWTFIRLLDLQGAETKSSLLLKFEITDAKAVA
ncbi:putative 1-phosphatidylinositol-4,5-bisphosphate phosphodiesterase 1 [Calycina marina]|uniref:Phosphoinositide phospholipase C n=1 Tax=Calycina marina TaxID=1763456 RepID=A0A9P7Z025_9HELO|nr:putative 1-phosphatidylinositol-4,5-bisphosphate phosphodiesterase 1 [Calycina marina]